jgi:hypothetical protein
MKDNEIVAEGVPAQRLFLPIDPVSSLAFIRPQQPSPDRSLSTYHARFSKLL